MKTMAVDLSDMASEHWLYVESVLAQHNVPDDVIRLCGFHYRTAFVHGAKHAIEAMAERGIVTNG